MTQQTIFKPTIVDGEWTYRLFRIWRDENGLHDEPVSEHTPEGE